MLFQVEAIIGEAKEFERRRGRLVPEDQAHADYLLKRVGIIRGGICYAILMGVYWTLAFFSLVATPLALVELLIGGDNLLVDLVIIGIGIFLALLGLAIYRWLHKRRLEFERELVADPRLARVFKTMGFISP